MTDLWKTSSRDERIAMAKEFVCVPVSEDHLRRLAAGEELSELQVFLVNDQLLDSFGLTPADDEEADRAAMLLASLWALSRFGRRLVLTAFVAQDLISPGAETANGGATLTRLLPPQRRGVVRRRARGWSGDRAGA